jgi:hypothetical protein
MNHTLNSPEEESLFAFGDQPNSRPSNELEATLRRVQRASGVDTAGSSTIPADIKQQIWEDLMSTNATTMGTAAALVSNGATRSGGANSAPLRERTHRPRPSNTAARALLAVNTLLAAALILALAAGIWRATGGINVGFSDDDGPNQPSIPFGGAVTQVDDGIDLPTAEDCTVEPLTVDEVLWYVSDIEEASYSSDIASPGPIPTEFVPATNPPNFVSNHPSQEDLNAVAETQRMLTACVLADSYFQVWALLEPYLVRDDAQYVLPPLTGEADARAILEDLESNGPGNLDEGEGASLPGSGVFGSLINKAKFNPPESQGIWLLDTDPANSWQPHQRIIIAGYATYNEDGTLLHEASSIFENIEGTPVAGSNIGVIDRLGCSFEFIWNEARQKWLVSSGPTCMG